MNCEVHGPRTPEEVYSYPGCKPICKACMKEKNRKRYEENREDILKKRKTYREDNKEEISKRHEVWRKSNLDKIRARQARWYSENREYVIEKNGSYYKENRGVLLEHRRKVWAQNREENLKKHKEWREENRGIIHQNTAEYRLKVRKEALLHYSDGFMKCNMCGIPGIKFLCLDHKDGGGTKHRSEEALVRGQSVYRWARLNDWPDMFQVLCWNCNYIKHHSTVDHSSKSARSSLKIKEEVFKNYSPDLKCIQCGIQDLRVLTIDHINGSGRKHLESIGVKGGQQFYRWIRKSGYPKGFQVLCFNCNCSKNSKQDMSDTTEEYGI